MSADNPGPAPTTADVPAADPSQAELAKGQGSEVAEAPTPEVIDSGAVEATVPLAGDAALTGLGIEHPSSESDETTEDPGKNSQVEWAGNHGKIRPEEGRVDVSSVKNPQFAQSPRKRASEIGQLTPEELAKMKDVILESGPELEAIQKVVDPSSASEGEVQDPKEVLDGIAKTVDGVADKYVKPTTEVPQILERADEAPDQSTGPDANYRKVQREKELNGTGVADWAPDQSTGPDANYRRVQKQRELMGTGVGRSAPDRTEGLVEKVVRIADELDNSFYEPGFKAPSTTEIATYPPKKLYPEGPADGRFEPTFPRFVLEKPKIREVTGDTITPDTLNTYLRDKGVAGAETTVPETGPAGFEPTFPRFAVPETPIESIEPEPVLTDPKNSSVSGVDGLLNVDPVSAEQVATETAIRPNIPEAPQAPSV